MATRPINFSYYVDPNIYMDYKELADPFTVRIPVGITNSEAFTLYFRILLVSPPAGYSEHDVQLGSVGSGVSTYKTWTFKRAIPVAKVTDALTARLMAYKDAGYTDLYGYKDLPMNFYLFNRDDGTLVDSDNFDGGTVEGWAGDSGPPALSALVSGQTFLTSPYGLKCKRWAEPYDYLFFRSVWVNDQLIIPSPVRPPTENWYRIVLPLVPNQTNTIRFSTAATYQYGIYKSWNIGAVSEAYAVIHWRRGTSEQSTDALNAGDAIDEIYIVTF